MFNRLLLLVPVLSLLLGACDPQISKDDKSLQSNTSEALNISNSDSFIDKELKLTINNYSDFTVFWLDNPSVSAIKQLAKETLTIELHQYGDFEQTGYLPTSIVSDDKEIDVVAGDIVLYNSNQICLYYATNRYSFTKLGHINLRTTEIVELLDKESVTIKLELV